MPKNSSTNLSELRGKYFIIEETEALFLIVLEIRNSEKLCEPVLGV